MLVQFIFKIYCIILKEPHVAHNGTLQIGYIVSK